MNAYAYEGDLIATSKREAPQTFEGWCLAGAISYAAHHG